MAWLKPVKRNHPMKRRGFFSSPHTVCMQSFCLLHIVCLSITSPNRAKTAFKREKKMSLSPFNFLILAERKNLGFFSPRITVNQEVSQFFSQKSKRARGWGNLNSKRIWETVKLQPAYDVWVIVTAWIHSTGKLQAQDGSPWSAATSTSHRVLICYPVD